MQSRCPCGGGVVDSGGFGPTHQPTIERPSRENPIPTFYVHRHHGGYYKLTTVSTAAAVKVEEAQGGVAHHIERAPNSWFLYIVQETFATVVSVATKSQQSFVSA